MGAVSLITLDTGTLRLGTSGRFQEKAEIELQYPSPLGEDLGLAKRIANKLGGQFGVWSGGSDGLIRGGKALARRIYAPDLPGVLGNSSVTGELA